MRNDKINLDELAHILDQQTDQVLKERILAEVRNYLAEQETEPEEPQAEKPPTRDITILFGSQEAIDAIDPNTLTAFTVQVEEGSDHNNLIPHLIQKAQAFNAEAKTARSKIRRLGEVFDTLKPKKHLEQFPKRIYTKESALILKTTNIAIPNAPIQ
jgi:hypothetical protein